MQLSMLLNVLYDEKVVQIFLIAMVATIIAFVSEQTFMKKKRQVELNEAMAVDQLSKFKLQQFEALSIRSTTGVSVQESVSFAEELENVRTMLLQDKIKNGRTTNVIYMIDAEDFSMPSMIMQPIMESVIKNRDNLHDSDPILVASRQYAGGSIITIAENKKSGFEASSDSDQSLSEEIAAVKSRVEDIPYAQFLVRHSELNGRTFMIMIPDNYKAA